MKTVIIGAGNWGTTLACILGGSGPVSLWTNTAQQARRIAATGCNDRYLPGVVLPPGVRAVPAFSQSIDTDDMVVLAIPSHQVRDMACQLRGHLNGQPLVCASKGFDHERLCTMSEVLGQELPDTPVVVLSGPNIGREIAAGKPAKAVLASRDICVVKHVLQRLRNDIIDFEVSSDIKGVELCAALKGIIAVGVGIASGLELGNNFIGVLLTRGLEEFRRIADFFGIGTATIYGIAGIGDLLATCFCPESRNRKFGYLLGTGCSRDEALREVGMVVEGVQMARTIADLEEMRIPVPLFGMLAKIIFEPNGHLPHAFVRCVTNGTNHGERTSNEGHNSCCRTRATAGGARW